MKRLENLPVVRKLALLVGLAVGAALLVGAIGFAATKLWEARSLAIRQTMEAALVGQKADGAAWARAADRALEGARPLSGNGYKVRLLRRTIIRTLEMAGDMT